MLEKFDYKGGQEEASGGESMDSLKHKLTVLSQKIHEQKIPAVIVLEGWGASGKGTLAGRLIAELDPREYKVFSMAPATADEARYAWMRRYWLKVPQYGQMAFFDHSWYREIMAAQTEGKPSGQEIQARTGDILDFERQLCDDGYVLVKFFLHITRKEQRKRFERLDEKKATRWRVSKADWKQNEHYDEYYQAFDKMLEATSLADAPWTVLEASDEENVTRRAFETLIAALEAAIARKAAPASAPVAEPAPQEETLAVPHLNQVDLSLSLPEKEYRKALKECQERLQLLHYKLYLKKIPVVLAFEGWDAAGKGGSIHRLVGGLDARGYEVIPIAAPSQGEKERPFLWRFWESLPKDGHIAIFDRSWYGRVMVERIEGFCREDQWQRAYGEINRFERQLSDWGAVVRKFWLQIDKDEQLKRFQARESTPEKQYKITPEDWRNREKWDAYETAVDEMLQRTSTPWAPWVIVESNDKYFARIKVLKTVIEALEERL